MHNLVLFSCIIALVCLATKLDANKYSKSANLDQGFGNEERPFRMQKVNLLWTKAKKKLKSAKLADLYAELMIHDKHEAHLKKARASNLDEDGTVEAKVLKNYARIVKHFGLEESFLSRDGKLSNEIPNSKESEKEDTNFEDPKLQSMWKRAQEAGFSEKDLNTLKEEFQHQQMKINEFNFVHQELGVHSGPDEMDNTVDLDQQKLDLSTQELKKKELEAKNRRTSMKEGYMRLENLVSSMSPQEEHQFQDNRVLKLWALAKKTNWSEEVLDSFKEELKHFEHRLSKQAYYKEQLEMSADSLERNQQDSGEVPEKHQKLEERNEFLHRTVNKLYSELKTRVDKDLRHHEL